jgi:tripartite-type tricarboxylate transporter receptor subunit TctC
MNFKPTVAAVILFALWSVAVGAQTYPNRPIRFVVSVSAGGTQDASARAVANQLTNQIGQPVVIDNRGGANGIIGSDIVAKAAPDGYTLLYTAITFVVLPSAYKNLPFDISRDFIPVTNTASGQGVLIVVNSTSSIRTIKELIELGKKSELTYGSPGRGNGIHLIAELFNHRADIKMQPILYKGTGPILSAVLSNEIQIAVAPPVVVLSQIKAGRLRALGYSGVKRLDALPDVPTIDEAGIPGFQIGSGWHAVFAPAHTPVAIVNKLYTEIHKALQVAALRRFYSDGGYEIAGESPAQFQKTFQSDMKKWGDIARLAGIKPE